jgi:hypothetical protein
MVALGVRDASEGKTCKEEEKKAKAQTWRRSIVRHKGVAWALVEGGGRSKLGQDFDLSQRAGDGRARRLGITRL